MYQIAKPFFMICETPMHAGSGSDLGIVDQPIQRERHTSFPKIESSSLKGALRQAFEGYMRNNKSESVTGTNKTIDITYSLNEKLKEKLGDEGLYEDLKKEWLGHQNKSEFEPKKENEIKTIIIDKLIHYQQTINLTFGPENAGENGHAGALGFTDARLLLFPIKSMKGVFAWITCPKVLQQFERDLKVSGYPNGNTATELIIDILTVAKNSDETDDAKISSNNVEVTSGKIVLEEYTFNSTVDENITKLAEWFAQVLFGHSQYEFWKSQITNNLVILKNEDFTDFVNLSTEVITRNKINNATGTVEGTALFTEEYLPAESILYTLVMAAPIFQEKDKDKGIFKSELWENSPHEEDMVMDFFEKALPEVVQIGGNATLGKGLVRMSTPVFSSEIDPEETNSNKEGSEASNGEPETTEDIATELEGKD